MLRKNSKADLEAALRGENLLPEENDSPLFIGGSPISVLKLNSTESARVEELTELLLAFSEQTYHHPSYLLDQETSMLLDAFASLRRLVKTISGTTFFLGCGETLLIERGGYVSNRKGEVSRIIEGVRTSDGLLFSSEVTPKQGVLIITLCLCASIGGNKILEEVNGSRSAEDICRYLGSKLCVVESGLGTPVFGISLQGVMERIATYSKLRESFLIDNHLGYVHVINGMRQELIVPKEYLYPDISRVRDLLTFFEIRNVTAEDFLLYPAEYQRDIFDRILKNWGGGDVAISSVLALASSEFCDDALVMSRVKKSELHVGDQIIGYARIYNSSWRVSSICTSLNPAKFVSSAITPVSIGCVNQTRDIWHRSLEDFDDSETDLQSKVKAILVERKRGVLIENRIRKLSRWDSSIASEDLEFLMNAVKRYQSRLWVYNQAKGLNGTQILTEEVSLINFNSWDSDGSLNNAPHAISGVQTGIRMPFGLKGNVRFWNESRRPEAEMNLHSIPVAMAYSFFLEGLFRVSYEWS